MGSRQSTANSKQLKRNKSFFLRIKSAVKRLFVIGLLLLLAHTVFINSVTSNIIFSDRPFLSKGMALSGYLAEGFFILLWNVSARYLLFVLTILTATR